MRKSNQSNHFHYVIVDGNDTTVALDITFAERLYAFFTDWMESDGQELHDVKLVIQMMELDPISNHLQTVAKQHLQETMYQILEFYPMNVEISLRFDRDERIKSTLSDVIKTLGFGLNIDRASISLDGLAIGHTRLNVSDLMNRIKSHYAQCVMRGLYKMIGSLEVIGNPIGLIKEVRQGVRDLVRDSSVASSNDQLEAIFKGSNNLVKRSLRGTFRSISSMTGTVARGISLISFDRDHIRDKDMRINTIRPKGLAEGMLRGAEAVVDGLAGGVKGLVYRPYKEARQGGVLGLIRGLGKGIVATAVEPVGGFFEGMSMVAAGVARAGGEGTNRKRQPRTFRDDNAVIPYHANHSLSLFLKQHHDGQEQEIMASIVTPDSRVFVLTAHELLLVDLWGDCVDWSTHLSRISKITVNSKIESITCSLLNGNEKEIRGTDIHAIEMFTRRLNYCIFVLKQ
ncbi:hypothetical protein AKO1_005681 [Acrasis kona]|uniref:Intermembrane lipid transfer protein VPS13-like C-terminal domain-containing protein n=1 Tax=Acrasis kona TaxID=1008807 RepID=A0AAW2YIJ8_9EUKA